MDEEKYATVLVDKKAYRTLILNSQKQKANNAKYLCKGALDLLFSTEDLINSSGTGSRINKNNKHPERAPLDKLKVEAILGKYWCDGYIPVHNH